MTHPHTNAHANAHANVIYHLDSSNNRIKAYEFLTTDNLMCLPTNINKDKIFQMLKEAYKELSICMPRYLCTSSSKYDFTDDINKVSVFLWNSIGFIEYYEIKSLFSGNNIIYIDLIATKRGYGRKMMNMFLSTFDCDITIELKSIYYAIDFYLEQGFIPMEEHVEFEGRKINIKDYIIFVRENKGKEYHDFPMIWMQYKKLNNSMTNI